MKCSRCSEEVYLWDLCFFHAKEEVGDADEPDRYDDWKDDDRYNDPRHTPYNYSGKGKT